VTTKFEHWGIVELMGHQRCAGKLTEEMIGGANMLRVDVPNGDSFRTAYYGSSAIYALHITDEKVARAAASSMGRAPPYAYDVDSALRRLTGPRPDISEASQDEDEREEREELETEDDEPPY
jgi:hypothetical protein